MHSFADSRLGLVRLPRGDFLRVGYAGKNGQPYFAIGRDLVARGALTKENVSLQTIRSRKQTPAEAQAVMNKNSSYVFFRLSRALVPSAHRVFPLPLVIVWL